MLYGASAYGGVEYGGLLGDSSFNLFISDTVNITDVGIGQLFNNISVTDLLLIAEIISLESFRFSPSPAGSKPVADIKWDS